MHKQEGGDFTRNNKHPIAGSLNDLTSARMLVSLPSLCLFFWFFFKLPPR